MGLELFLAPRSVAVIGAGRRRGGVGRATLESIVEGGFPGEVWPVNPSAKTIAGRRAYPDVASLPEPPDLVVIAVPAAAVPGAVREAADAGVKAAIVLSAGFKESGPEGGALERAIVEIARAAGMRILGPNCLGLIVPSAHLNASFAGAGVPQGSIGFVTQSGALGTAIIDWARGRGGLSGFASLGNRADLGESDLLEAFAALRETRVLAGYLESVTDGARFLESARRLTRETPTVLLKSGVSEAGARAVSSHTGSLAGSDVAYEAAFRAAGVVRAADVEDLFGTAEAFAAQPVPTGPGVVILTNAGGPAVMATDACERLGVELATLGTSTIASLKTALPPAAAVYNPVDILGDAGPERYSEALSILAVDPDVHAIVVVLTPQAQTRPEAVAHEVSRAARSAGKTVLACFMGEDAVEPARRALAASGVPAYRYPERAIAALANMYRHRGMRDEPAIAPQAVDADRDLVRTHLAEARASRRPFVLEQHAADIAAAYGLRTPASVLARSRAGALAAARTIGFPVALKVASPDILHKSDIGGIELGLTSEAAVSRAWDGVLDRARTRMPGAAVWGALVQQMVPPGIEVIIGIQRDPTFGPLVMFGLGGVYVEVLHDVSFRLAPLDRRAAMAMIAETRAGALLRGARGEEPADIDAIADALVRLSALACDFPEIVEIDVNPLVVGARGQGALAADVRIGIGG